MTKLAALVLCLLVASCAGVRSWNETIASNKLTGACKAGDHEACSLLLIGRPYRP